MRRSTSKGGTGNGLLIAFLEEPPKSTSRVLSSRLHSDSLSGAEASGTHKNKLTARKGTLRNQPQLTRVTPIALLCIGYPSRLKYNVLRDWLCEACHMAWVGWEACCKGFCGKGPHYQLEQSVRNQLEHNQVQRALEKPSRSCLLTSNNQPISWVQKSIRDSSPGLYWVDLAEAYVMQEDVSLRILTRKGMIRHCPMDVWTRNLCKERRNRERKPVLMLVPSSHNRLTLRKCVMCSRNMGAHVQRGIQSTKGKRKGWEIGVPHNQERIEKLESSVVAKILEKDGSNKIRETCEKTMFTPSNPIKATNPIITA